MPTEIMILRETAMAGQHWQKYHFWARRVVVERGVLDSVTSLLIEAGSKRL